MTRFERICPNCGASNGYHKAQCAKCRAPLTGAPPQPPAPLLSRQTALRVAWRATKFMTVMGATLAWRGARRGIETIRASRRGSAQHATIEGDYVTSPIESPAAAAEQFSAAREWRVWSGDSVDDSAAPPTTLRWGSTSKPKTD
ncbi:MAG: hypothetical protein BroJett039_08940 [Chloroflexota bacterium]|nr:MAG: hypothetical protein BroJett039_08940 [Chloroflexota bacterium]